MAQLLRGSDKDLLKVFHTKSATSLRHIPARLDPLKRPSTPRKHVPISSLEGELQLFSKLFLQDAPIGQSHKPKKSKKKRVVNGSISFFFKAISLPVPEGPDSLKDLQWKAELGIPTGDLQREAKLSLALGIKYESELRVLKASKYFRRLFFAAELSEDLGAQELAVNRLATLTYNRGRFKRALELFKQHALLAPEGFIPAYNLGIVLRSLKRNAEAVEHFQRALETAECLNDKEGICISHAQLGLTLKIEGSLQESQTHMEEALGRAESMELWEIATEVEEVLGYIHFFQGQLSFAQGLFENVMQHTRGAKSEVNRVNAGVARALQQDDPLSIIASKFIE
jgi:tetratricopeptide (TPR) repeat protein